MNIILSDESVTKIIRIFLLDNSESMGGNARTWKELSCVSANFFYEHQNGEILFFTNHPYWKLPEKLKRNWK